MAVWKQPLAGLVAAIALAGSSFTAFAQAADDSLPATSNVRGAQYPRVHSDLRVTFRLKAADARKVQLHPGATASAKRISIW